MGRSCIYLLFFTFFNWSLAQSPTTSDSSKRWQQFAVQHDNDFLFAIDRYYTAGLFLGYSKELKGDFLLKRCEGNPLQLDLLLGQEVYTPRELFAFDFDLLERPYAGYLFLSAQLSKVEKNNLFVLKGEIGLAGEQSFARQLQLAYHELINEFIPAWSGAIANSVHVNSYGKFIKDLKIPRSNLFKHFALQSTLAFGTRRFFARQEAILFLGKRHKLATSSAFNRLGREEEFYGYLGVGGEYVLLNALIQGHPFGDNSPFTLPVEKVVLSLKAGVVYRGLRNSYAIVYRFRTKETDREGRSQFTSLLFSRRF